jgi:hypothetical protein
MMVKVILRSAWLSVLGLALATLASGCQEPNETESNIGGPEGKGVADPKYAQDTPEAYRQYYTDSQKKAGEAKLKGAPPPAKSAAPKSG